MSQISFGPSWFVRKDLDGFFGLMIDNPIQLILIVSLRRELIHLPDSYIFGRILPGAAISILVGNIFYAWQARQLARATGREDVTALPYGINTVSLFVFVFLSCCRLSRKLKIRYGHGKSGSSLAFSTVSSKFSAPSSQKACAASRPALRCCRR